MKKTYFDNFSHENYQNIYNIYNNNFVITNMLNHRIDHIRKYLKDRKKDK